MITRLADIGNHTIMIPEIVSTQADMAIEIAGVKGDVARLTQRMDPLEDLPLKVAVLESRAPRGVSATQCEERRGNCEVVRKGKTSVQVASIQAAASIRGKWLLFCGSVVAAIAAAVGAVVAKIWP